METLEEEKFVAETLEVMRKVCDATYTISDFRRAQGSQNGRLGEDKMLCHFMTRKLGAKYPASMISTISKYY